MIKAILNSPRLARLLIKPILRLHSFFYSLAGILARSANNYVHPKHNIMRYPEWFASQCKPNWVVLDIGCNTGKMVHVLSQKVAHVYGIDKIKPFIEQARDQYKQDNITFFCEDALNFNYSNLKAIDCITLSNVLEHIDHRKDFLVKCIDHINWSKEGVPSFLIRVPLINRDWITVFKKNLGLEYRLDKTHCVEYTEESLKDEISSAGLNIVYSKTCWGEIWFKAEKLNNT